jgi:hypothetical protein
MVTYRHAIITKYINLLGSLFAPDQNILDFQYIFYPVFADMLFQIFLQFRIFNIF